MIEAAAAKILGKHSEAEASKEIRGPVPVADLLRYACRLSTEHLDFAKEDIAGARGRDLYGCLYPDGFRGKDRLILVNTAPVGGHRLSRAEQRITIAHEAGHYVLHCGNKDSAQLFFRFAKGPTFCREVECQQTLFNQGEHQASAFAACLLMPREQFLSEWQKQSGSEVRLARYFDVTQSFVRFRAKILGLGSIGWSNVHWLSVRLES